MVANQFISMPIWVMMGQIVPPGAEGSVFALVSSLQTVGSSVSGAISAVLTGALGVTLDDYSGLPALTLATSLTKVRCVPRPSRRRAASRSPPQGGAIS